MFENAKGVFTAAARVQDAETLGTSNVQQQCVGTRTAKPAENPEMPHWNLVLIATFGSSCPEHKSTTFNARLQCELKRADLGLIEMRRGREVPTLWFELDVYPAGRQSLHARYL